MDKMITMDYEAYLKLKEKADFGSKCRFCKWAITTKVMTLPSQFSEYHCTHPNGLRGPITNEDAGCSFWELGGGKDEID